MAEVGAEAPADEPAVEEAPAAVPTAQRRGARAPAWAWVVITLMALLLASGLITLAIARNANPSTPAAVEDVQTLVVELEALNGYLATTNELMSNAIASAQQLNADRAGQARGPVSAGRRRRCRRRTCALAPWRPALRDDALRARQGSGAASVAPADARGADRGTRDSNCSRRSAGLPPASTTGSRTQRTGAPIARRPARLGSRRSSASRPRPTSPGLSSVPRSIGAGPRPSCSGWPFSPSGMPFRPSGSVRRNSLLRSES